MPMHQSVSTIAAPEFINLQPMEISPLMSSCEIKVLYLGENRNRSFISKEVATEMAKTLRGAPIVGAYSQQNEDFGDHGQQIVIDNDGIKFNCLTKPYGFVAPDAKVWFQTFTDIDDFGNEIEREYLMTTGYLWTEQFPECKPVVEEGRPHSMELHEETLDGHWAKNNKTGIDFFIINDAIFSKLCILGNDVEPCFEGSSVTSQEVSTAFTKVDDDFKNTLFSMMQELKFALEGGQKMIQTMESAVVEQETPIVEQPVVEEIQDNLEQSTEAEIEKSIENPESSEEPESTFEKKEDEEDKKEDKESNSEPESKEEEKKDDSSKEEEKKDEEDKKKYSLLQEQYDELSTKYSNLEAEYNKLVEFKNRIDDAEKDKMIDSFYMLSAEDKAEVIENKAKYSLDEIESKLSVICVRKKVNFDLDDSKENEVGIEQENPITTFDLGVSDSTPAWIKAIQNTRNKNI